MGRRERRVELALMRASGSVWTFLVPPDDARLRSAPLLAQTASQWLDLLSKRPRYCIICSSWLVSRGDVGLLLLATPTGPRPSSATSCCGICKGCSDADLDVLERAAEKVLREALPGRLEPVGPRR